MPLYGESLNQRISFIRMKIDNYSLSIIGFSTSVISSFLLFVGLFSAHWDYIVEHTFDTIFVLFFGALIPLGYIAGIFFIIKGILSREYSHLTITILVALGASTISLSLGLEIFTSSVLKLYKLKLGVV